MSADGVSGITFAPAFLESGVWRQVAELPDRYAGTFTPTFVHPLLVRGTLALAPKSGQTGPSFALDVTLTPEPGFRIGNHQPGERVEFTGDHTLFGGRVGIVIDARGRPVSIPDDPESRVTLLRAWLNDMGSVAD